MRKYMMLLSAHSGVRRTGKIVRFPSEGNGVQLRPRHRKPPTSNQKKGYFFPFIAQFLGRVPTPSMTP
ncbi:hypothetical protein V6N12_018759 [Hibiscus sabdariffa]|uniref:Uncharacterized protein n=1 Tax=Hibiscus sabdariffa TaxID=183260 RepID=A0ABR2AI36_9ROSI